MEGLSTSNGQCRDYNGGLSTSNGQCRDYNGGLVDK